ncbi:MAG: 50S ribosomal protein L9 [Magnetococcales bacterium]|nr:50S ribosomal protein L9 [Magnetococcales bacterium]
MDVILLEKISKLGELGSVVKVRGGYGRNFLIPQKKALPATAANKARFEQEKADFEQKQAEVRARAEALAARLTGLEVVLDRPAGSGEKLFGAVTNADIAEFFKGKGVEVERKVIEVAAPIKTLGEHIVRLRLHPDVVPELVVRVERSVK